MLSGLTQQLRAAYPLDSYPGLHLRGRILDTVHPEVLADSPSSQEHTFPLRGGVCMFVAWFCLSNYHQSINQSVYLSLYLPTYYLSSVNLSVCLSEIRCFYVTRLVWNSLCRPCCPRTWCFSCLCVPSLSACDHRCVLPCEACVPLTYEKCTKEEKLAVC